MDEAETEQRVGELARLRKNLRQKKAARYAISALVLVAPKILLPRSFRIITTTIQFIKSIVWLHFIPISYVSFLISGASEVTCHIPFIHPKLYAGYP